MITIQVSSDPYKRKITYERVDGEKLVAIDSSSTDTPEKLKLLSVDYSDCFFPFKAYEIASLIWHTYSTNSTPVCIRFKGTADEYEALCAVCDILNNDNSTQPPEKRLPELTYEQADECLANAGDILPEVKGYFKSIKDIISNNITASDSKARIEQQQEMFDDVSKKEIPVCVIGNYSSGKSTFINAVLGCEVLPSGDKPMTAKIYEIRCSDNSEVADVEFTSNHTAVTISFNRGVYTIRPDSYSGELSVKIRGCLEEEKEHALAKRVQALLQVINDGDIDDRVKIHIPFNSDSPLRSSEHPYVLFDTPGDNVANHEHHIQVLQEALRGMSNGLMLYVTVSNQLHTMSNQQLCDKVKAIREIDTRFTMVIVNQADNADFSEYNRAEIIESPIPHTLQPEGIYYVSSIMALGSKINGDFVKDNNAMIYMQKQAFFMKKKEERFAQLLFLYNIAPKQIENDFKAGALKYSELGDKERMLANSGLWAIEQEIQRFADNYALYNKCYQSLLFLQEVTKIAENDIDNAKKIHSKSKDDYQNQLDADKKELLARLEAVCKQFAENAAAGYIDKMKEVEKEAIVPITREYIVQRECELTSEYEEKFKPAEEADNPKEDTFKLQNILKADVADVRAGLSEMTKRYKMKAEIDKDAAKALLNELQDKLNCDVEQAQIVLFQSSGEYWKAQAEKLKKELLKVVEASDISQEKREELQGIIKNFEQITFPMEEKKELKFEKENYERHTFFKIEDNRLNKYKLVSDFNRLLTEKISGTCTRVRCKHSLYFEKYWQKPLFSDIEDNITEYNSKLGEAKKHVAFYEDLIVSLSAARDALNEYISKIDNLMAWRPVISENSYEE